MPTFLRTHLTALRMLLVMTVILGIAYPLLVTGVSQLAFHERANGSIVRADGRPVGSSLLGQRFDLPQSDPSAPAAPDPKWFQPRPSAGGYDPTASGASNLGPNSADLLKTVQERRAAVAAFDGVDPATVPPDALTASGSGLDPQISVAYAKEQVNRVARERGLPAAQLDRLIEEHTDGRSLGFLGQSGVNVLELNKAVAALK
ncbi:potassium-transporting ATPase subunit KdpC [Kitasatospora cineracea]|uniref:potassium-transporting ATPase subunit KdpC n=1 Tax=Kitasatospora cineracea TaxID=88074 RepID=UPI00343169C6